MRIVFAATALLIAVSAYQPARAETDPYKWCAIYSGNAIDGSKGCWFTTLEQCNATVTGLSGFCLPNTFYNEPAATHAKRTKKRVS
jgi:hypothetical protein